MVWSERSRVVCAGGHEVTCTTRQPEGIDDTLSYSDTTVQLSELGVQTTLAIENWALAGGPGGLDTVRMDHQGWHISTPTSYDYVYDPFGMAHPRPHSPQAAVALAGASATLLAYRWGQIQYPTTTCEHGTTLNLYVDICLVLTAGTGPAPADTEFIPIARFYGSDIMYPGYPYHWHLSNEYVSGTAILGFAGDIRLQKERTQDAPSGMSAAHPTHLKMAYQWIARNWNYFARSGATTVVGDLTAGPTVWNDLPEVAFSKVLDAGDQHLYHEGGPYTQISNIALHQQSTGGVTTTWPQDGLVFDEWFETMADKSENPLDDTGGYAIGTGPKMEGFGTGLSFPGNSITWSKALPWPTIFDCDIDLPNYLGTWGGGPKFQILGVHDENGNVDPTFTAPWTGRVWRAQPGTTPIQVKPLRQWILDNTEVAEDDQKVPLREWGLKHPGSVGDALAYNWDGWRVWRTPSLSVQKPDDAGPDFPSEWEAAEAWLIVTNYPVSKQTTITALAGTGEGSIHRDLLTDYFLWHLNKNRNPETHEYGYESDYRQLKHDAGQDIWNWENYKFLKITYSSPEVSELTLRLNYRTVVVNDSHVTSGEERWDAFSYEATEHVWERTMAWEAGVAKVLYVDLLLPSEPVLQHVDTITISGFTRGAEEKTWTIHDIELVLYNPTSQAAVGDCRFKSAYPRCRKLKWWHPWEITGYTSTVDGGLCMRPPDQPQTVNVTAPGIDFCSTLYSVGADICPHALYPLSDIRNQIGQQEGFEVTPGNVFSTGAAAFDEEFVDADDNNMLSGGLYSSDIPENLNYVLPPGEGESYFPTRPHVGAIKHPVPGMHSYLIVRRPLHTSVHGLLASNEDTTARAGQSKAVTLYEVVNTAGTAASGAATQNGTATSLIDSTRNETGDYWNGTKIAFTSGQNAGQSRIVTGYDADAHRLTWSPGLDHSVILGDGYTLTFDADGRGYKEETEIETVQTDAWSYYRFAKGVREAARQYDGETTDEADDPDVTENGHWNPLGGKPEYRAALLIPDSDYADTDHLLIVGEGYNELRRQLSSLIAPSAPCDQVSIVDPYPDGKVWLFWSDGSNILYQRSLDGMQTWQPIQTLSAGRAPSAFKDSRSWVHVFYEHEENIKWRVWKDGEWQEAETVIAGYQCPAVFWSKPEDRVYALAYKDGNMWFHRGEPKRAVGSTDPGFVFDPNAALPSAPSVDLGPALKQCGSVVFTNYGTIVVFFAVEAGVKQMESSTDRGRSFTEVT